MKRILPAALLAVLLAFPSRADAQSAQRFSMQVSGIANLLFGDPDTRSDLYFGSPKNGFGGEIQLRYTPSAFSVGVGYQYAVHDSEEAPSSPWDREANVTQDFTLTGFFIEPRYVATATSSWALYLSGRLAYSSIEWTSDGTGYLCNDGPCTSETEINFSDTGEANGYTLNAGGGVLVRLTDRVNLDLGGTFGLKDFGDLTINLSDDLGATQEQTGALGRFGNTVLRVGLAIGLGG